MSLYHYNKLKGSVQASPMWLFRSDFPSCSESSEIWHDSFSVKKCPWIFFHKRGNKASNTFLKVHPPPPTLLASPPPHPSNSVKDTHTVFWLSRIEILHCLKMDRGGGGGGGVELDAIFLYSWKKTQGHFLTREEQTCQISADSQQLGKSLQNI